MMLGGGDDDGCAVGGDRSIDEVYIMARRRST